MKIVPKVQAILDRFKQSCRLHGWKTADAEDWVEAGDKYHSFLWAKSVHSSSFKRIMAKSRCVIRRGLSYEVVDASYIAWLFLDKPKKGVIREISDNPAFAGRTALYDLSQTLEGRSFVTRLNNTDSPVFLEFERFLRNELGIKFENLDLGPEGRSSEQEFKVQEIA